MSILSIECFGDGLLPISSMNLVYADLDRRSDFLEAGQRITSTITFFIAENSTYKGRTDFKFKDSKYTLDFSEFEKFIGTDANDIFIIDIR